MNIGNKKAVGIPSSIAPWLYVLTSVAKFEMSVTAEKSATSVISSVRNSDCRRSAQNLRDDVQSGVRPHVTCHRTDK